MIITSSSTRTEASASAKKKSSSSLLETEIFVRSVPLPTNGSTSDASHVPLQDNGIRTTSVSARNHLPGTPI
jgi:hypothetical protein